MVGRAYGLVKRNYPTYLPRVGRPGKTGQGVYVRLPEDVLARVDARVDALKARGGLFAGVTRSDVIREAVAAQMDVVDAETRKGKGKR